jgi:hypothetical protein
VFGIWAGDVGRIKRVDGQEVERVSRFEDGDEQPGGCGGEEGADGWGGEVVYDPLRGCIGTEDASVRRGYC